MLRGKLKMGIVLVVIASLFIGIGYSYAERQDIVIGELNWSASVVVCQIMKNILEDELNIPTKVIQLAGSAIWPAMEKGTVDIFSEMWDTAHDAGIQKYVKENKTVELTVSYQGKASGFYIPTWVSKKYNIKSIEDLNKHTALFDITGDKKGDLWVGGFGWSGTEINKIKIRDYGLNYEPYVIDQWVFMTTLKEAMRVKKPIIFFYWAPEWIYSYYDMTQIKEPAFDPAKWHYVPKKPEESNISCSFRKPVIYVGYPAKLKKRLPKAYKFYKNWYIPMDEVNNLIAEMEDIPGNPKKDAVIVAKQWIADHPEIVKNWLKGVK